MEQLSGLDARFVYAETPTVHMHTLKVAVVDHTDTPGGFTFERFREVLTARLDRLPPFRWRLVEIPWGLGHPVWIEDPDFAVDRHISHATLPAPGTREQLDALVGGIASAALDRRHPLWQITAVDGLERGRVAYVAKIHHAMADGMAAAALLRHVLDVGPDPEPLPPVRQWRPEPVPSRAQLVLIALRGWLRAWRRAPDLVVRTLRGVFVSSEERAARRATKLPIPLVDPPRTPFNRHVTARRSFATADLSLAEARFVKSAFGVALNDVLLAVCADGIRRTLDEAGALPRRPLTAGVPMSTHVELDLLWGNHVGNFFTTLATDEPDPVARLRKVHAVGAAAKARAATAAALFEERAAFTPPLLFAGTARVWGRTRLANLTRPPLNVVVSNVAGPPEPLFVEGGRLEAMYSVGPILEGIGLNVTIWSYAGRLHVSALSCPDLDFDLRALVGHLEDGLAELVAAAKATAGPVS